MTRKIKDTNEVIEILDFANRAMSYNELQLSSKGRLLGELSDLNLSAVYFSGQFPTIYFKRISDFDRDTLTQISLAHKKIWNERKVPFLIVNSPIELRIYNCFEEPIKSDQVEDLPLIELYRFNVQDTEEQLEELVRVFSRCSIDSGAFWKEKRYAAKLDPNKRVDKALMRNLQSIRRELENAGLRISIIHDLLLRSLFILYLEDRKATTEEFYDIYRKGAKSYFDILDDLDATYLLFDRLEKSFNGNLCPVTLTERKLVKLKHLQLIKECFWSHERASHGQDHLFNWRVFDFSVIRIELISEIYEEFLSTERGENKTKKDGAYYTPHSLVDFVLNEKLPWGAEGTANYQLKILDPTCGSGIFLVESFKRIVDRWKYAHNAQDVDFNVLKKLLVDNIFGIELNKDAIKVAAFSLYLALLDYLNPRTLWQDKKFPYLIYDQDDENVGRQGKNLFRMSSLEDGPFAKIKYDLIVGNPPFKRGNLPLVYKRYLASKGFAQEYVLAFLFRATELCPTGSIALVSSSKILFNGTSGYSRFRDFLFNENYVEAIYNFSALRKLKKEHGGSLFASAVGPACVLFYQKRKPERSSENLLYCSPKSLVKNRLVDGVAIDVFDVKYVPRYEASNPNSRIWKIAMWGTESDFKIVQKLGSISRLSQVLRQKVKEEGWSYGNGFQTSNPAVKRDDEISSLKVLDTEVIKRYYVPKRQLKNSGPDKFRRLGDKKSYFSPHMVVKKGQSEKKFCAAFLDYDCSFRDGVYGIHAPKKDAKLLKVMTAYFNSSLAAYYLFMTISSLGVEREQIMLEEYLNLPALPFQLQQNIIDEICELIDAIINETRIDIFADDFSVYEQKIDALFFAAAGLSKKEVSVITDTLAYSLDLFLTGEDAVAYSSVGFSEQERFAKHLCNEINHTLKYSTSDTRAIAHIFELPFKHPLKLIQIKFVEDTNAPVVSKFATSIKVNEQLRQIDNYTYEEHSESIYFRKVLKYYHGDDSVFLIKPNEKRFWSTSSALNDANELIFEIVNA